MKLSSLLKGIGVRPSQTDAVITGVTDDVDKAGEGTLFVCVKGDNFNGHSFAKEAVDKGSPAVVCEEDTGCENAVFVENTRLAFSRLCAYFYGRPDKKLRLVGVTGTNGKTTTSYYIKYILESLGRKCALIGTLGADTGEGSFDTGYTTPQSDVFFSSLDAAARQGNEYCVCEVSSQALAQYRVDGADFSLGVFTNIGTDHLDYHKTVAKLVEAKTRLCSLSGAMLLNADDAYCEKFLEACSEKRAYLYSCKSVLSDFTAKNIRPGENGSDFILFNGSSVVKTGVNAPGMFTVYNALCAASACMALGADINDVAPLLPSLPAVPGRMQLINKNGVRVFVDFAHTPDALSAVLRALRPSVGGKLITVFGCGGDRDKLKRPLMGETAARLSDETIITSDNPRTEDPLDIIKDIKAGIKKKNGIFTEADREKAIRLALNKALPGDTVLIAGKGHESYQTVGSEKKRFSDAEVVTSL